MQEIKYVSVTNKISHTVVHWGKLYSLLRSGKGATVTRVSATKILKTRS